jgi:hypothetical protein
MSPTDYKQITILSSQSYACSKQNGLHFAKAAIGELYILGIELNAYVGPMVLYGYRTRSA